MKYCQENEHMFLLLSSISEVCKDNTKNMCDPLDIPNQTSFTSDIEKDVGVHNEASDKQNDS
jgi:hypothetical protein